jgi:formate-dependent nitrite reductase membrane component NrfD
MRFVNRLMALSTTLLLGSATAAMALQESPVKIDVQTTESHTSWYADPFWLGIGGVAVLIVLVLAVMASRSGKTTTTVVR